MSILITGASGFVGQELAAAFLTADPNQHLVLTDIVEPTIPSTLPSSHKYQNVTLTKADLLNSSERDSLLATKFDSCYLLHGIMSSGSEANLDLGLRVNFDSSYALLQDLRHKQPGVKVIYTSSLAVYGPPQKQGEVFSEYTTPFPQSSYGTEKLMIETLVNDFSRRGLIDGRICRLPTVIVRPGKPSAAASSFVSGIVRESLNGIKNSLPVQPDLEVWICSTKTVIHNLQHARTIPASDFGIFRTTNLPGLTVTVEEILEALEDVAGKEARDLVVREKDEETQRIFESWQPRFETERALRLGYKGDGTLQQTIRDYADRVGFKRSDLK